MNLRALSHLVWPKLRHAIDRAPQFGAHPTQSSASLQEALGEQFVTLVGWVFHPYKQCRLELRYNNSTLAFFTPHDLREDVAEAYPLSPTSLHSGFEVRLPLPLLKACPPHKLTLVALFDNQEACIWSWNGGLTSAEPSQHLFDQYYPHCQYNLPRKKLTSNSPLTLLVEGSGYAPLLKQTLESAKAFIAQDKHMVHNILISVGDEVARNKIRNTLASLSVIWPKTTVSLLEESSQLPSGHEYILHLQEGALLPTSSSLSEAHRYLQKNGVDIISFPKENGTKPSLFSATHFQYSSDPGFAHLCSSQLFHSLMTEFSSTEVPNSTFQETLSIAARANQLLFTSYYGGTIELDANRLKRLKASHGHLDPQIYILLPPEEDIQHLRPLLQQLLSFHEQRETPFVLLEETSSFPPKTLLGTPVFSLEEVAKQAKHLRASYLDNKTIPFILSFSFKTTRAANLLRYLFDGKVIELEQNIPSTTSPEEQQWLNWSQAALHLRVDQQTLLSSDREALSTQVSSYEKALSQELQERAAVSIIVPVYNALSATLRCLRSVLDSSFSFDEVIVVDDASDTGTAQALEHFCQNSEKLRYIRREQNGGFLEACYSGLSEAKTTNDIVLLNSDVALSTSALSGLYQAAYNNPTIAAVSPLSTGSYQFELPMQAGDSLEQAAQRLAKKNHTFPQVILPEGQMLYLKRWAIERFGFFDRVFERGFCEESDLCMRLLLHGCRTVCADNTLIFHEQSASFGKDTRHAALERNQPLFDARWSPYFQIAHREHLRRAPLECLRQEFREDFPDLVAGPTHFNFKREYRDCQQLSKSSLPSSQHKHLLHNVEVVFLLPNIVSHGGSLSVLQHVNELLLRGVEARIVALQQREPLVYPLLCAPLIVSPEELIALPWTNQKVIATFWSTAYLAKAITLKAPETTGFYYIQDYEPWFFPAEHQQFERESATATYDLGLQGVVKTSFLKETVEARHNIQVSKITPGLANTVFYPGNQHEHLGRPRIAALFRPSVPRRGAQELLELLTSLTERCPEVDITLFGETKGLPSSLSQRVTLAGTISQSEVAELYRHSEVCIDLSQWHGFGRMGIESMACGVVPLLSDAGGIHEYARHGENSLIFKRSDSQGILDGALKLLYDRAYRQELRGNALLTASTMSEKIATEDWLSLFGSSSGNLCAAR